MTNNPDSAQQSLYVRLVAQMDEFLADVEKGFQGAEKIAADSSNVIAGLLAERLSTSFAKIDPDLGDFFGKIGEQMRTLNVPFEQALTEQFAKVAEGGKALGFTIGELHAMFEGLHSTVKDQLGDVLKILQADLARVGVTIKDEAIPQVRDLIERLFIASDTSKQFEGGVKDLAKDLTKEADGAQKGARAVRDHAKATKEAEASTSKLDRGIISLVKRFATMLFGIYALRRAWTQINGTIKESQDLFLQAVPEDAPIAAVLKGLENDARKTKIEIGGLTIGLKVLGDAIKTGGLQLLAVLIKNAIPYVIQLGRTFIEIGTTIGAVDAAVRQFAAVGIMKIMGTSLDFLAVSYLKFLKAIKPVYDFLGGPIKKASDDVIANLTEFHTEVGAAAAALDPLASAQDVFNQKMVEGAGLLDDYNSFVADFEALIGELPTELDLAARQLKKAFDEIAGAMRDAFTKAARKYADRLVDIERKAGERREDLARDLARDLAAIDVDAERDRADITRNAEAEEIRIRQDHAEKIRNLEQQLLYDLEDAVRERDARGVLLALRKFNADKAEANREKTQALQALKKDTADQLAELARRRAEQRADRMLAYEEALADQKIQTERQRQDALRNYQQERADIIASANEKLKILAEAFQKEYSLSQQQLDQLYKLFNAYYGPGGAFEQLFKYFAAIQSTVGGAGIQNVTGAGPYSMGQVMPVGFHGRQRGGSLVATSPTLLKVGEGVPERVDITPLSEATGAPRAGFKGDGGGNGGSRVEVAIDLGEGLVGDIVDKALDETAEVLVTINQGQRRQAR